MKKNHRTKGFTLIEILVSVAIFTMVSIVVSTFQRDIFSLNRNLQSGLNAQLEARHVIKIMVAELRKASPSSLGAYPIELASSTGITFYSDVDNDGLKDKVRYFLNGTTIKKGVIAPTGNPYVYTSGNERITTIVNYVIASSTLPIFEYHTSAYAGTSTPLSQPVTVSSVRLIKINVIIDTNPLTSPRALIVTTQVTPRNLKDNL